MISCRTLLEFCLDYNAARPAISFARIIDRSLEDGFTSTIGPVSENENAGTKHSCREGLRELLERSRAKGIEGNISHIKASLARWCYVNLKTSKFEQITTRSKLFPYAARRKFDKLSVNEVKRR